MSILYPKYVIVGFQIKEKKREKVYKPNTLRLRKDMINDFRSFVMKQCSTQGTLLLLAQEKAATL